MERIPCPPDVCGTDLCPTFIAEGMCYEDVHHKVWPRRLTPTECERLQSLPDGYTAYGKLADGQYTWISDTQRYKALGNGFNADVIRHILSFMLDDRGVL